MNTDDKNQEIESTKEPVEGKVEEQQGSDDVFRLGKASSTDSGSGSESEPAEETKEDEEDEVEEIESEKEDFNFSEDPMESAYDLEAGKPLKGRNREIHGKGLPTKNYIRSVKEFFNTEALYRFDILEPAEQDALKGSYSFELEGEDGGAWTLVIDQQLDALPEKKKADVEFKIGCQDFVNLVNGQLNPQLAILAEKIQYTGDYNRVAKFNRILVPSGDN